MEQSSLIQILPIFWKNKYLILGATLFAGIASSIIMLMKPNYYKSSTTFYPVNSALLEPSVQIQNRSFDYYGDDRDVDRLLSIAKSNEVANQIIEDFALAHHYDINIENRKGQVKLLKKFKKLSNIQKTAYDAMELSVEDEDPEIAQKMAIEMRTLIDMKAKLIVKDAQQRLLNNLTTTRSSNQNQIARITDSLNYLRTYYGIYDTQSQGEALATLEAKSPGDPQVTSKIQKYNAGVAQVMNLESVQTELNEGLAKTALQIQQVEASLNANDPAIHIIEEAHLPLEKSRPRRSLYVLGSMIVVGFTCLILVLFREQIRGIRFE